MSTQQTVHVRATNAQVRRILAGVPRAAAGSSPAAKALLVRIGLAVLSKVKQAFLVKAAGGTDECGLRWKPLSPRTIAYSRKHPGLPKKRDFWKYHPSYAVTKKQRARWWELYYRFKARFGGDKHRAASLAWVILKSEYPGIQTLMQKYGSTRVEVLRDTGVLYNSLSPAILPGVQTPPVPPPKKPQQVFRLRRAEVGVGTNRRFAGTHHRGVPGRIPRRPLWPDPSTWTAGWWDGIVKQARYGVVDLILYMLRGNP